MAGSEVTIPVPSDNIDPDGDSVALLGVGKAPTKGVASVAGGALRYRAPERASGTDRFTYVVQDPFGATSTGTVSVGIAAPSAENQLPTAVPDEVVARPGRKLSISVTANDTDPDGDAPILIADSVEAADDKTNVEVRTRDSRVELTTPGGGARDLTYTYEITDRPNGIPVEGVLTVHVRPNAPLLPPVARDDVVLPLDVLGRKAVEVDVLANDEDPDGAASELIVSVSGQGARAEGDKVAINLSARRRVVLYTVTDQDGLSASAVVAVPGLDDFRPVVDPREVPLTMTAGDKLSLSIPELVIVRDGHDPSLTFGSTVSTSGGGTAKATDQRTVSFAADRDYEGLTAVSFEVTDGKNADDPKGLKSTLSVPIEVKPLPREDDPEPHPKNTPPACQPTALSVAPGEDATEADLRAMCQDPDSGDELTFALKGKSGAAAQVVDLALSGSTLTASAPTSARPGTSVTAVVTATDGKSEPVQMQLPINVVDSTRPLISLTALNIDDAKVGETSSIDVADHATNPFADEGGAIELLGARVAGGDGAAKVATHGTTITVTPTKDGQVVVDFTVADATGEPSRQVSGTLAVTVRDKPDAPTAVTAETQASETATVRWRQGDANGSPITGFTVHWKDGDRQCGLVTTCTITGLTNQVDYTFTVTAANDIGESDESGSSNVVTPDRKPDPPSTPTTQFGDTEVALSWTKPTGDFSAVKSYTVEISPRSPSGVTQREVTANELVWDGLANGTAYRFRVEAHNDVEDPSDWSGWSADVVPAGQPATPAAPTVAKAPADNTQPSAVVSWTAPDGNGDDNLTYELVASNGRSWTTTATSQQVTMDASSNDVTFKVRASNKAVDISGPSEWSADSAPQRFFQRPGSVSNLQATETGQNNQVKVTFGAAPGNGALPQEMSYHWAANGQSGTLPAGGATLTNSAAFPNGQNVNVEVWASSNVRGETVDGGHSADGANAFGPPTQPTITGVTGGYHEVRFSWNGSNTGNGRSVQGLQFRINGGGWRSGAVTGSYTAATGAGSNVTIEIQTRNQSGWGAISRATGRSWDASAYRFTRSSQRYDASTYYVNVQLWRYKPNSIVVCTSPGVGYGDWSQSFRVDGNGHWGPGRYQCRCRCELGHEQLRRTATRARQPPFATRKTAHDSHHLRTPRGSPTRSPGSPTTSGRRCSARRRSCGWR